MIDAYSQVGDDLYNFVVSIDISEVTGIETNNGWANTFNRVFQPDEVTNGGYPVVAVIPAEDEGSTLDSRTDSDKIVYWVVMSVSQEDVFATGEGKIRQIADIVRNALRTERSNPNSVFSPETYDAQFSGTWGWDTDRAERFYRLVVTVNVAQDFE